MSAMPPALNLNLPPDVRPRLAQVEAWRQALQQSLDSAAQEYAPKVQSVANDLFGATERFDENWQTICREVLAGKTEESQAVRDYFLSVYEFQLTALSHVSNLARVVSTLSRRELPELVRLEEESRLLGQKVKNLTERWRTAEDLEDLAAESLAPSPKTMEAVRQKHGYPQAWYDDNSTPF